MKTKIFTILALMLSAVTFAQEPERYFPYPGVQSPDGTNGTCVAWVYIDGVKVETDYELEVAFFDMEGNCRMADFVRNWGGNAGYHFESVFYGVSGEPLTFRFYNHTTQELSTDLGYVCTTSFNYIPNLKFGELKYPETIEFFSSRNMTFASSSGNNWSTLANWTVGGEAAASLPGPGDNCTINSTNCQLDIDATVNSISLANGKKLTVTKNHILNVTSMTIGGSTSVYTGLTIEDGAQVYTNANIRGIYKKDIAAYSATRDNYYFVSSPVSALAWSKTGMLTESDYDLYFFDGWCPEEEWQNYEYDGSLEPFANMNSKRGYLYANEEALTLQFPGKFITSSSVTIPNENDAIAVDYCSEDDGLADNPWACFNLIGNPFVCNAEVSGTNIEGYYMINVDNNRKNVIAVLNPIVAPATGLFAVTNDYDATVTFTQSQSAANVRGAKSNGSFLNLEVNNANGNLVDRAYVEMNEGEGLKKFNLNNDATQIYFQQNGKDYAIVHAERATQLPVFFKTREYGTYTINVKLENLTCEYLHLIDNLTGMDVDLLATPSYTFQANSSDYAARFKIVFEGTGVEENTANESFAIVEGNRVIIPAIEHESTLEVIDMTGRTVSSQKVNGSFDQTLNVKAGLYILNLNGMIQKIVIE